jgi:hypothetical protein
MIGPIRCSSLFLEREGYLITHDQSRRHCADTEFKEIRASLRPLVNCAEISFGQSVTNILI